MNGRRRRRRIIVAGIVVLGAAGIYATADRWLPYAARRLDVGERPVKADYALVLAGDDQSRPFGAAALYKAGYVGKVLLTHPSDRFLTPADEGDVNRTAKAILQARGVPAENIVVLDRIVESTFDEARALEPIVRREPQARFVVVTSDYHSRRARWIVRRTWPELGDRLHVFTVPTDGYSADDWWRSEAGLATYLKEYARCAFYGVRYGWGGYVLAGCVVAAVLLAAAVRRRKRSARIVGA